MDLTFPPGAGPYRQIARRTFRDAPAYAAWRLLAAAWRALPPRATTASAAALGRLLHAVSRSRRRIVRRNLDIAFRDSRTPSEKRRIARQCFEHAVLCAASFVTRDGRIRDASHFELDGEAEHVLSRPHPRGIAFFSAHVGDWELAHYFLGLRGIPTAIVTREVANPFLHREIDARRRQLGGSTIPKRGALLALRRLLAEGRAVGLIADQNCPRRRHFFPYFGTLASTYVEAARLVARTDAEIAFIACLRQENGARRYRIIAHDLRARLPQAAGLPRREVAERQARALVEEYLSTVEGLARGYPEQTLWMHRRWKSRPTGAPWLYHRLDSPLDLSLLGAPAGEACRWQPGRAGG